MKNRFDKVHKFILPVAIISIVIIICTACEKEDEEQKMMASVLAGEYLNDSWKNGMQILNARLADELETLRKQPDDLTEDDSEVVNANEENEEDNTDVSQADEESSEDDWDVDFDIVRTEYIYDEQRNGIEIYYPQLCGLANSTKEDTINALIEEDVKKIIGDKNKEGDDSVYCVVLDYKIKFLNERIISILYKGMYGYIMPGHGLNAKVKTTTIDIEEEKVITLKDVVTDFTELSDMLMADEFEHVTKWDGSAGGYKVSWEFKSREELEDNLGEVYQQWYTDGNNFVVIIENMMADYNEYAISNESVKYILDGEFLGKLEKSYSHSNVYFYDVEETVHTYEGYFYLHTYTDIWRNVDLHITNLESFSNGALYALELEQPEFSDPFDKLLSRKYIGYFYVTDEVIYYLAANEDGYTDENNSAIISQIKSDEEKFLKQCIIVCREDGTEDITDENGYHAYVQVDGERRIFRCYNDYLYGSKDYMLMVWEKGKGLTYYMHGNGAKNMHVEFGNDIKEEQKINYGYPYNSFTN